MFRGIGRCQVLYQNLGRNKLDFLVDYLVETLRLLCYEGNMPLSSHLFPSTEISEVILFIFTHMNPPRRRRKKRAKKPLKTVELCNMELVKFRYAGVCFYRDDLRVKNHLFLPVWYLSSNAFLMVFLASSLCEGSLKVSWEMTPFKVSSSIV